MDILDDPFDDTLETVHDLPERVVRCGIWLSPRRPKPRCCSPSGKPDLKIYDRLLTVSLVAAGVCA